MTNSTHDYPFPPEHSGYWKDPDVLMTYHEAVEAFNAQSEQDKKMRRNPVRLKPKTKSTEPSYPFPPKHSMSWQKENNTYGVSYDQAVEMFHAQTPEEQKMGRNPLTSPSTKKLQTQRAEQKARIAKVQEAQTVDPVGQHWPPYDFTKPEGEKQIEVEYTSPIVSIAVLSLEEAHEFSQNLYAEMGGRKVSDNFKTYVLGVGKGTYDSFKLAQGLGGLGVEANIKKIRGKDWVIIKNFRRHQQTLMKGNKWRVNNPQVIKLGIGLKGIQAAKHLVRVNVGLEVAFSVGINAVDFILRDKATLGDFVDGSAYDIVKGVTLLGISAAATGAILATAAGTILGAGLVFVAVSFVIGYVGGPIIDDLKDMLEEQVEKAAKNEAEDYIQSINGYSHTMTDAFRKVSL
ncbi:hypothetical protein [Vibrio owensii]|uniref:hypothetical protein n=1 Tax=Vibrio owensii TaxID=696485 RepID=UPI0038CF0458